MELEMSIGKSLGLWGRGRIASVVLTVLYGGIYELYQTDPRIQKEIDRWPEGMTYAIRCSTQGPPCISGKMTGS